ALCRLVTNPNPHLLQSAIRLKNNKEKVDVTEMLPDDLWGPASPLHRASLVAPTQGKRTPRLGHHGGLSCLGLSPVGNSKSSNLASQAALTSVATQMSWCVCLGGESRFGLRRVNPPVKHALEELSH
ncbi:hypothetical protein FQN60_009202, partial [Etheostoma spectabile]